MLLVVIIGLGHPHERVSVNFELLALCTYKHMQQISYKAEALQRSARVDRDGVWYGLFTIGSHHPLHLVFSPKPPFRFGETEPVDVEAKWRLPEVKISRKRAVTALGIGTKTRVDWFTLLRTTVGSWYIHTMRSFVSSFVTPPIAEVVSPGGIGTETGCAGCRWVKI